MGRFNAQVQIQPKNSPKVTGISNAKPNTVNKAGGEAYSMPLRHEIATCVLNSMLNDGFYAKAQDNLTQLQGLVERADKAGDLEFVAKAAIYARHTHGLRTVSHLLAGEIGDRARGEAWKRPFYSAVIQRPDDVCEVLSYWNARHPGVRHPNAMLRGFGQALVRFDAYALAKYRGQGGKEVNLVDAVNLCHPRAPKGHAIHKLMTGKLEAADTWEKAISAAGKIEAEGTDEEIDAAKTEAKGEEWKRLIKEKKLGYLALLRNLRNIAAQAPDALQDALAVIEDEKAVLKSRVFPFQFRKAYEIGKSLHSAQGRLIMIAVAKAADISLRNVPAFPGKTLVVVDDSGSMTGGGEDSPIKIASIFAAALMKALPTAEYMQFASDARFMNLDCVGMSLFALAEKIEASATNGSTNFVSIFTETARHRKVFDRVIILSDMQGWVQNGVQEMFAKYAHACRQSGGQTPKLYSFDLKGHGTAMFPADQVCLMAGFSDKVFTVMGQMEQDRDALVKEIEAVNFGAAVAANEARAKARTEKHAPVEYEKAPKAVRKAKATAKKKPGKKSAKARKR